MHVLSGHSESSCQPVAELCRCCIRVPIDCGRGNRFKNRGVRVEGVLVRGQLERVRRGWFSLAVRRGGEDLGPKANGRAVVVLADVWGGGHGLHAIQPIARRCDKEGHKA